MARPRKQTQDEPTEQMTCSLCGKPLAGKYIHAGAVATRIRGRHPQNIAELAEPVTLCGPCVASGQELTLSIEWRRAT